MIDPTEYEPVDDGEILYRRIPASQGWYDPGLSAHPAPDVFRPNEQDTTGLSVYRARFKSLEEAAQGRPGKSYYVAVLRAGDLRAQGIEVAPRPIEDTVGHAELPGLTHARRKSNEVKEWKQLLAQKLCPRVEGPFCS